MTENTLEATKVSKPVVKVRGIGTAAVEAIKSGLSNKEALAVVLKEFPEANTTMASIAWYRNNLTKQGEDVRSPSRRVPKKEKPVADPNTAPKRRGPKPKSGVVTGTPAPASASATPVEAKPVVTPAPAPAKPTEEESFD